MMMVNILGILIIFLIIYWFWLYQGNEVNIEDGDVVINVADGTYQPSRIKISAHKTATLVFNRKDQSPCAATLLIPKLEVSEELPLGKNSSIILPALDKGEYEFHCQMQMYRGMIVVE